jgi:hypothetical protein
MPFRIQHTGFYQIIFYQEMRLLRKNGMRWRRRRRSCRRRRRRRSCRRRRRRSCRSLDVDVEEVLHGALLEEGRQVITLPVMRIHNPYVGVGKYSCVLATTIILIQIDAAYYKQCGLRIYFQPPGSGFAICMRIRIQQLKLMGILADPDTDPDPKPCYLESQPCREMKIIWFSHWEVVL